MGENQKKILGEVLKWWLIEIEEQKFFFKKTIKFVEKIGKKKKKIREVKRLCR